MVTILISNFVAMSCRHEFGRIGTPMGCHRSTCEIFPIQANIACFFPTGHRIRRLDTVCVCVGGGGKFVESK